MKIILLCLVALLLAPLPVLRTAEPSHEKTDLPVAGQASQVGNLPHVVLANGLPGIVVDDDAAEFTGSWVTSSIQPPLVGTTYRHDNNTDRGHKTAMFTPKIPAAGEYEVRLLYTCHENRSTKTSVTIHSADGEKTVTVNQRHPVLVDRVPRALGLFRFGAGTTGHVVVSNKDANGYVVVDGVQFVRVEVAGEERAGKRDSGFADIKRPVDTARESARQNEMAAAVAVSPLAPKTARAKVAERSEEPVQLAASAPPAAVDGKSYDVVIIGGTGGGVACAVRAAREGCTVLLVQHNGHIGGMMTNGLMQWDALYGGPRSSLFTELLGNIEDYYIATFGRDSRVHQIIRYTHEHYPIGWAEPHVAEREYNRLVAAEENITSLLDHYPTAVEREGAVVKSVTLRGRRTGLPTRPKSNALVRRRSPDLAESADRRSPELANDSKIHGDLRSRVSAGSETRAQREILAQRAINEEIVVHGSTFVDATYEGDLFALAKVPYRVGREARGEYDEPHAGKVFVNIAHGPPPSVAREGLNIRSYGGRLGTVDSNSPFTADGAVQAYNYRFCVTADPANRIPIPKPTTYRREEYVDYGRKYIGAHADRCPNRKSHVNSPILPGENHDYPEADWPAREKIIQRHLDFGLGLMWFLQNDESVSQTQREKFRMWGLPKDEYADNGHVPYEMYVREARRIVGRHVSTEHDGMLAKDFARTPVRPDSIAVTDWYMDSHACTTDSRPEFKYDGKLILTEESRPSQIPYRSLLPQGVDNLLVPVCLSATHVAWGAIRLEPVYMQTGEAAGFAAALAKQQGTTPAALNPDLLVRTLVERRQLVSFFNDLKVTDPDPSIPAAQYFGTKGFFSDYNARLDQPLTEAVAILWIEGLAQLKVGALNPNELAARMHKAESSDSPPIGCTRGDMLQDMWKLQHKHRMSDK